MPVSRDRDCLQLLIPLLHLLSSTKAQGNLEEPQALAETDVSPECWGQNIQHMGAFSTACGEAGAAVTSGNGVLEKGPILVRGFIGCWVRDHLWKLKILHLSCKSGLATPFWGVGMRDGQERHKRGEKWCWFGFCNLLCDLGQNEVPLSLFPHLWTWHPIVYIT